MDAFGMVIGGQCVGSEQNFDVINPATENIVATCPTCSVDQLESAILSAQQTFVHWQKNEAKRRKALIGCARVVKAHIQDLAKLLTLEQGKPLHQALYESTTTPTYLQQRARQLPGCTKFAQRFSDKISPWDPPTPLSNTMMHDTIILPQDTQPMG